MSAASIPGTTRAPASSAPLGKVDDVVESPPATAWLPRWLSLEDLPGWALSIAIHAVALLALMLFRYHLESSQETPLLSALEELQQEIHFDNTLQDQVGTTAEVNSLLGAGNIVAATAESVQQNAEKGIERTAEAIDPEVTLAAEGPMLPKEGDFSGTVETTGGTVENTAQGGGGVEGAIDRLTWEIQQSLHERKTTVVWLFDQSLSLKERRNLIADRFENVYRQLESLGEGGSDSLQTVVATYGEKFAIVNEKPTSDIKSLIPKVRSIANDPSGKENVFGAVTELAKRFLRERSKGRNVRFFIITDEKGDDAERWLEEALVLCRRGGIRVYVVGNVAPFGREKAFMDWKFEDGESVRLAYDAGPETVEPESLNVGLWGNRGVDLDQMSSGYGPYGLTRLCKETGGLYFVAQEDSRLKFSPAVMRSYTPDYRPIVEYQKQLKVNRAKLALVTTAKASKIDNIPLPRLDFPAYNDNVLRETVNEAQKPAAELIYKINRLGDGLTVGEKDREKIVEPRWRAAYDLALGRALAMRVRADGYNLMLAEMKSSPRPFTNKESNEWRIVPSKTINSGAAIKKEEKRAAMYLKRVMDEHPGTPWAHIAELELSTPMGWEWQEQKNPAIFAAKTSQEDAQRQIMLAEERAREEAKKRPAPMKPRDLPKL
ncbi:MAG: vWA domain-containing protein [Planctomycetaceae bacterium]